MFLFFAFAGTQVANINGENPTAAAASTTPSSEGFSPIVLTYIALSFGFSLMVNVWIFYRISGGLFNPAVTLAMVMVKSLGYTRGFLLVCAQIAGSIVTSLIVKALFPVEFNVRTTLSPGTSLVQGVVIEALLTAELVFAIFMLAKEKHRATFLAPIGIGIAMFVAELVGVYYTGGSLNPARSFGPCVVTGIWDKEHWIYWVGPAAGAIAAVGFYNFIKLLEYEMANPGQDSTSEEKAAQEAEETKAKKDEENTSMV
jgi:aquaporin related protein